ncbi:MAG: cation:proton antiporter [Campylobacterales bacterium]
MHLLFWIGFLFLVGYVSGVLSERFRLPKVTGYLLVGLLLSPSVSGLLPPVFMEKSEAIVHFALAVVAFMIGGSLKLEKVRKLEKSIVAIMLAEAELAFFFVAAGMMALLPFVYAVSPYTQGAEHSLMVPLFLGAISAATAPAAVLAVIHQYRARGPLTLTLLGVVATDDAAALINFSVVLGVGSLLMGLSEGPLYLALLDPLSGTPSERDHLGKRAGYLIGGIIAAAVRGYGLFRLGRFARRHELRDDARQYQYAQR